MEDFLKDKDDFLKRNTYEDIKHNPDLNPKQKLEIFKYRRKHFIKKSIDNSIYISKKAPKDKRNRLLLKLRQEAIVEQFNKGRKNVLIKNDLKNADKIIKRGEINRVYTADELGYRTIQKEKKNNINIPIPHDDRYIDPKSLRIKLRNNDYVYSNFLDNPTYRKRKRNSSSDKGEHLREYVDRNHTGRYGDHYKAKSRRIESVNRNPKHFNIRIEQKEYETNEEPKKIKYVSVARDYTEFDLDMGNLKINEPDQELKDIKKPFARNMGLRKKPFRTGDFVRKFIKKYNYLVSGFISKIVVPGQIYEITVNNIVDYDPNRSMYEYSLVNLNHHLEEGTHVLFKDKYYAKIIKEKYIYGEPPVLSTRKIEVYGMEGTDPSKPYIPMVMNMDPQGLIRTHGLFI